MKNKLYDALEICLKAMKNGVSLEAALARFPDLAPELRPLLKASQRVHGKTIPAPSAQMMQRGRAHLLQQAAEMREARRPARRQSVIPLFQRLAIAASLSAVFLLSGTGLVQASSSSLPGENLYPVKRSWEDMRLLFVFSPESREAMAGQYDQERLDEVSELLRDGRVASITFTGLVTADQNGNLLVSGVPVEVNSLTLYSGDPLVAGTAVTVTGQTLSNGHVTAATLQVVPAGAFVPTGEPAEEGSSESNTNTNSNSSPSAGSENGNSSDSNENGSTGKPQNDAPNTLSGSFHIAGVVQSVQGNVWIINGQTVYMDNVTLPGNITVGSNVNVKGYFTTDGRFIVTRIDINNSGPNSGSYDGNNNGDGNTNSEGNGKFNSNDSNNNDYGNANDNNNENGNNNYNYNSNENENHNGNDNSGSNTNANWNNNEH